MSLRSDEKWTEPTKAYLRGAKVFTKEVDPNHLTTIGITYRTDRLKEIGLPDVLQYHEYDTGKKTAHLDPDYPIKNPNESHFSLLRMDGTEKPAAKILRDAFASWSR